MSTKKVMFFRNTFIVRLCIFITISVFSINLSLAQGDLLIFPKRIVFDDGTRVKQIVLSNTGKDSAIYNVSFIQFRMNEYGEFQTITEPDVDQQFATPYLRVYPRKVVLAPNESQIVKIQVRKSNSLDDGEYRSHLYFRAENNNDPLGEENKSIDTTAISVKLEAVFGISIPTIINKGASTSTSKISDIGYEKDESLNHILSFNINRSGNMSIYGDISISYTTSDNKSYEVANVKGIAVYTPGEIRKVKMILKKPGGVNFIGGKFKVVYSKNKSNEILAENELSF